MHLHSTRSQLGRIRALEIAIASWVAFASGGCGLGSAGIAAASNGGSGGSNAKPVASSLAAPRSALSPATISFELADEEGDPADVQLLFRGGGAPGSEFRPITLAPGSPKLLAVPSNASVPYHVDWDFAADLGDESYHGGIELQLLVENSISPAILGDVAEGNDAPQVLSAAPYPPGEEEYGGNANLSFAVRDSSSDVLKLRIEFNANAADGFPADGWKPARPAGTSPLEPTPEFAFNNLPSSAQGVEDIFVWDTVFDLNGFDDDVLVRFIAEDEFTPGVPLLTSPFRVDNNEPPTALLDEAQFYLNPDQRRGIPIAYRLLDPESDPLEVLIQWRREGEKFPDLPSDPADLIDLLKNPDRAEERKVKQVATEAPIWFDGHVGWLPALAPNEVRLPELAGSAAGLLSLGVDGRKLEVLRPSLIPEAVSWSSNPFHGPVAAVATSDSTHVWVLDQDPAGWRVIQVSLETGAISGSGLSGVGAPRALAFDPIGELLFVATDSNLLRFDTRTGASVAPVPHSFEDGPRGLAILGTDLVAATGDEKLNLYDFAQTAEIPLLQGLLEPWGVAVDPLHPNGLYISERGAHRVLSLDLRTRVPQPVPAKVDPADVPVLGSTPFPNPRALAVEGHGGQLLVMTEFNSGASLRGLPLRTTFDRSTPPDGLADPFVYQVSGELADPNCSLSTGPDRLRVLTLPQIKSLAVGGGVAQVRSIASKSASTGNQAVYDPRTQVVTLEEPFDPNPPVGSPWRIPAFARPSSSPSGVQALFLWDTFQAQGNKVLVRILPIDGDVGVEAIGTLFKDVRTGVDVAPVEVIAPGATYHGSLTTADLDGDGDLDLLSVDWLNDRLTLFFQTAPGSFDVGALPTPGDPSSVAAGDLDQDGDTDLAYTQLDDGLLRFVFQTAPGVFTPSPDTLQAGLEPRVQAVADLDGDLDLDLVVANSGSKDVSLFLQTSPGAFAASASTLLIGDYFSAVAVADLDQDFDLDLVCVTDWQLLVFWQSSPGTFEAGPVLPNSSHGMLDVEPADLDGDGDIDIVTANWTGSVSLFLQTEPGVFAPAVSTPSTTSNFNSVTAADLDGDLDIDLALASHTFQPAHEQLTLFLQTSKGQFTSLQRELPLKSEPWRVIAEDFDGDGDMDLASSGPGLEVTLHLQSAPGAFDPEPLLTAFGGFGGQSGTRTVAAGDLDADGDLDLVSSHLKPLFQTAVGVFTPGTTLSTPDGPIALADLDGDGDLDLASADSDHSLSLIFQETPGSFVVSPSTLPTGLAPNCVAAADLDQDGDMDLVTANRGSNDLTVAFQTAPGTFTASPTALPTGPYPWWVAAADLDTDGDTDLVSANLQGYSLSLFLQTQPGVFTPVTQTLYTGKFPVGVVAADLDQDGDNDLAAAPSSLGCLRLYFQTSPGDFTPDPGILDTQGNPSFVLAIDLDRDLDVDLVAGCQAPDGLELFLQVAPGDFVRSPRTLLMGSSTLSIAAADLDGDGEVDLVGTDTEIQNPKLFFGDH